MSQMATTLTPGTFSMCLSKYDPRLPTPMKATRTVSLGDCAERIAALPASATEVLIKLRRVKLSFFMGFFENFYCKGRSLAAPRSVRRGSVGRGCAGGGSG